MTSSYSALTSLQVMQDAPVIPVLVFNEVNEAVPVARALVAGGIRMLEVTLRTPVALECMKRIAAEVSGAVVGAGTVRTPTDMKAAKAAGARFAVSPGFTPELGQASKDEGLALLPGVATGSELMLAMQSGFTAMKFFPAIQAGGVPMLKAFAGPFFDIVFCPTGGINAANAQEFLSLPNVACVGGSWLVPPEAVTKQDWSAITNLARQAAALKA